MRTVQRGAVLGKQFQPYESHIPFLLQVKVGVSSFMSHQTKCGTILAPVHVTTVLSHMLRPTSSMSPDGHVSLV